MSIVSLLQDLGTTSLPPPSTGGALLACETIATHCATLGDSGMHLPHYDAADMQTHPRSKDNSILVKLVVEEASNAPNPPLPLPISCSGLSFSRPSDNHPEDLQSPHRIENTTRAVTEDDAVDAVGPPGEHPQDALPHLRGEDKSYDASPHVDHVEETYRIALLDEERLDYGMGEEDNDAQQELDGETSNSLAGIVDIASPDQTAKVPSLDPFDLYEYL